MTLSSKQIANFLQFIHWTGITPLYHVARVSIHSQNPFHDLEVAPSCSDTNLVLRLPLWVMVLLKSYDSLSVSMQFRVLQTVPLKDLKKLLVSVHAVLYGSDDTQILYIWLQ